MFLPPWKKLYLNITFPFHGEPLESRTSNHYLSAKNGVRTNEVAVVDLNLQYGPDWPVGMLFKLMPPRGETFIRV